MESDPSQVRCLFMRDERDETILRMLCGMLAAGRTDNDAMVAQADDLYAKAFPPPPAQAPVELTAHDLELWTIVRDHGRGSNGLKMMSIRRLAEHRGWGGRRAVEGARDRLLAAGRFRQVGPRFMAVGGE